MLQLIFQRKPNNWYFLFHKLVFEYLAKGKAYIMITSIPNDSL